VGELDVSQLVLSPRERANQFVGDRGIPSVVDAVSAEHTQVPEPARDAGELTLLRVQLGWGWARLKAREAVHAAAVRCLTAFGYRKSVRVEDFRVFVQTGNDQLAAAAIDYFGAWGDWGALPDLEDLFRRYHDETKWKTGRVGTVRKTTIGRQNWMEKYGDPRLKRARPVVTKALKRALLGITGEEIETPEALAEILARPEAEQKIKKEVRSRRAAPRTAPRREEPSRD